VLRKMSVFIADPFHEVSSKQSLIRFSFVILIVLVS